MGKFKKFSSQINQLLKEAQSIESQSNPLDKEVTTQQAPSMRSRISTPQGSSVQTVVLPFHFHLWNLRGDHSTSSTQQMSSISEFQSIMSGFRRAEFLELAVKLIPTHRAIKYPFTVEAMWVPQDRVMSRKVLMSSFGMQSMVVGEPQSQANHMTIHANLNIMNPIMKDSINYNDTPKLFMCFRPNEDVIKLTKKKDSEGKDIQLPILCCVALTGVLKMSSPSVNFVDTSDLTSDE